MPLRTNVRIALRRRVVRDASKVAGLADAVLNAFVIDDRFRLQGPTAAGSITSTEGAEGTEDTEGTWDE